MNYLTLCQDFVREFGLAGGTGPASVVGQTGELGNVVRWIRDAELHVNTLWHDWDFLWREHSEAITSGQPVGASEAVRYWNTEAFYIDRGTIDQRQLRYAKWSDFRTLPVATADPQIVTVKPDRTLVFDAPVATPITFYGEYWKSPRAMTANTSEPEMPEEFHRIIIARAAIMYGNREDAPEIISGGEAEYIDYLDKLQSAHCPSFKAERMSEFEETEVGAIPGFD